MFAGCRRHSQPGQRQQSPVIVDADDRQWLLPFVVLVEAHLAQLAALISYRCGVKETRRRWRRPENVDRLGERLGLGVREVVGTHHALHWQLPLEPRVTPECTPAQQCNPRADFAVEWPCPT